MKEKKDIRIIFKIENINTLKYFYDKTKFDNTPPAEKKEVNFNINVSYDIIVEKSIFSVIISVINHKLNDKSVQYQFLETKFDFKIKNLKKIAVIKDNTISGIPDKFILTMLSIAIGSIRGILAEKCKECPKQLKILPPIDPIVFLKNKKQ